MPKEKSEKNLSIIKFLKENDEAFFSDNNIIWAEKAFMVSSTSFNVCVAVGISLNMIKPFGITGYTTIEQNIL